MIGGALAGALTDGRVEVLIEARSRGEGAGAEAVAPCVPSPGLVGSLVGGRGGIIDEVLGNDAVGVPRSDELVELVSAEVRGIGADTRLEVRGEACGCSEVALAEWAVDDSSPMGCRIEVLQHRR